MVIDVNRLSVDELKNLMANAKRLNNQVVYNTAFERFCELKPEASSTGELSTDPVVLECWKAIHAAEQIKTEQNKKTTRLSRTRQKITRDGIIKTMEAMALKIVPSDGFNILINAGMPHLTFEYIIISHPNRFSPEALLASTKRLLEYEVSGHAD